MKHSIGIYEIFLCTTAFLSFCLLGQHNSIFHESKSSSKLQSLSHQTETVSRVYDETFEKDISSESFRILHIVTSLSEYEDGARGTKAGEDRLINKLIPILQTSVESFLSIENWTVDVYLVLGYELAQEREALIAEALPSNVGLEVWDDAIPFHYKKRVKQHTIELQYHTLARQHRFVLKDKLNNYDFFSVWEDDMVVTAAHIQNYLEMNDLIEEMKEDAAGIDNLSPVYGSLSKKQIDQLIPGFIRVEVINDDLLSKVGTAGKIIPPTILEEDRIDPMVCCKKNPYSIEHHFFENLSPENVQLWETDIKALGVRKLPGELDWVGMLPRPFNEFPSFWSGTDGAYGDDVKNIQWDFTNDGDSFGQQAGFMATKKQVEFFHSICTGGFLPPFTHPYWQGHSGLRPHNVEFWSGGFQLFGVTCKLQRIISMDPKRFSHQLLFHASNNKQATINPDRFVRADHLLGQLRTVQNSCKDRVKV